MIKFSKAKIKDALETAELEEITLLLIQLRDTVLNL
jgi:hypothetical protein